MASRSHDPKARPVWKLTLCFDGSGFRGWQIQPGHTTIQGTLQAAIRRVTGELVLPQGSGRTDAGVHALAHVASFSLAANVPAASLHRALNHALPPSIRVLNAVAMPPGFHARHSARRKTYEYRLFRGQLCPPWLAPYVAPFTFPLHLDRLHHAAAAIVGTHDFRSFESHATHAPGEPAQAPATTKTIFASHWTIPEPDLLIYHVCGSGFLHHMVRNLVGSFLAIGRGQMPPDCIPGILAARSRTAAGPTAPASGLWLHSVAYPEHDAANSPGDAASQPPVLR